MSSKPFYIVSFIYVKTNPYFWSRSYSKQPLLRKKLKLVLCTKFCPLCDKEVIAWARLQLRINSLEFSKFANFVKTLKICS